MLPPMYTALMYTVSCPQDQKEGAMCLPSVGKSLGNLHNRDCFEGGRLLPRWVSYYTGKKTIAESKATLMIF